MSLSENEYVKISFYELEQILGDCLFVCFDVNSHLRMTLLITVQLSLITSKQAQQIVKLCLREGLLIPKTRDLNI